QQSIAAALERVGVVVSCIDQPGRRLLNGTIERGLMYTDIAPHLVELGRGAEYERLCQQAAASGARVVLGTGIVPGISNVMVRALADRLGGADEILTSLLPAPFLLEQERGREMLLRFRRPRTTSDDPKFALRVVDIKHGERSATATLVGIAQ